MSNNGWQTLLLLTLGLALAMQSPAQTMDTAIIRFANQGPLGINAPFFEEDGTTGLSGEGFQAALYFRPVGTNEDAWMQVGPPQPFRTTAPGFWVPADRQLPAGPSPGTAVVLQVRFWDSAGGQFASFEAAKAAGARIGVSVAIVVTPNPPPQLTYMAGLQSASLMPTITLSRGLPGVYTTSSTVTNGTQLTHLCGEQVGLNRWFRFTSPYPGTASINTIGSSVDTVMSVYTGSIISPSSLTLVACNDNRAMMQTASEVRFTVEANTLYLLCAAGKNGSAGTIRLNHTLLTELRIRRMDSARIELSWPADATNFFAQTTTNCALADAWQSIPAVPEIRGSRRVLDLEGAFPHSVFRLRWESP